MCACNTDCVNREHSVSATFVSRFVLIAGRTVKVASYIYYMYTHNAAIRLMWYSLLKFSTRIANSTIARVLIAILDASFCSGTHVTLATMFSANTVPGTKISS